MELALIIAMIIVVPLVFFLAVFVWYINRRIGDTEKMVSAMRTTLQTFVGKMTKP